MNYKLNHEQAPVSMEFWNAGLPLHLYSTHIPRDGQTFIGGWYRHMVLLTLLGNTLGEPENERQVTL